MILNITRCRAVAMGAAHTGSYILKSSRRTMPAANMVQQSVDETMFVQTLSNFSESYYFYYARC